MRARPPDPPSGEAPTRRRPPPRRVPGSSARPPLGSLGLPPPDAPPSRLSCTTPRCGASVRRPTRCWRGNLLRCPLRRLLVRPSPSSRGEGHPLGGYPGRGAPSWSALLEVTRRCLARLATLPQPVFLAVARSLAERFPRDASTISRSSPRRPPGAAPAAPRPTCPTKWRRCFPTCPR